ncbi:hypothetical protein ABK040_003591 [Willaertia magna]
MKQFLTILLIALLFTISLINSTKQLEKHVEEADNIFLHIILKGASKDYIINKNWDNDSSVEQADKFWKKLFGVVKLDGKGAIKSFVDLTKASNKLSRELVINSRFRKQRKTQSDLASIASLLSPKRKIVCNGKTCGLGKKLPLSDSNVKFFKKLGKLLKKALPYLKVGVKEYVNNNFDQLVDKSYPINWWDLIKNSKIRAY